jgi:hypothetical protein
MDPGTHLSSHQLLGGTMFTLPRLTARLAAVAAFAALLAAACNTDSTGPSSPTKSALSANRAPSLTAASTLPLGTGSFAILGNAAVTCTNGTIIGDVGTFAATPTGAVTLTTCPITGTVHVGDAAAIQAYNAFLGAYTALAPKAGDVCPIITGTLAGMSFAPGVYCVSAEAKTGVLTLNGPSSGTWTFKVAPGAFTGTSFSVVLAGGAQACNVTWWVDAASTMTDSNLKGTILAGAAITLTRGTLIGRGFAKAGVTVTGTAVTGCVSASGGKGNGDGDEENEQDGDDDHGDKGHHDRDKHHDKDKDQDKDKHHDSEKHQSHGDERDS